MPRITYECATRAPEVSGERIRHRLGAVVIGVKAVVCPSISSRHATHDRNIEYRSSSLYVGQSLVERNPYGDGSASLVSYTNHPLVSRQTAER